MRATIDLDNPTVPEIVESWNRLSEYGEGPVFGRVSSSGKGVHLKVHGCSEAESDEARRRCGDDPSRRRIDRQSDVKPPQILFSEKSSRALPAAEWSTNRDRVIAEYRARAPATIQFPTDRIASRRRS